MSNNTRDVLICISLVVFVLGAFVIGAWLVMQGHPWWAAFIIILGASSKVKTTDTPEKKP